MQLGSALRRARYLVVAEDMPDEVSGRQSVLTRQNVLGTPHALCDSLDWVADVPGSCRVVTLHGYCRPDPSHFPFLADTDKYIAFDSYAGLRLPCRGAEGEAGKVLTYHDYAEMNAANRLGVLKGDVDDLGRMFVSGLSRPGESRAVRMMRGNALSTQMHHFFCDCIDSLCREEEYERTVMVVYSGGDDLFCVGSWDRLVEFGAALRERFRNYSFDNPAVSISMGCVLTGEKFPIHRGAELAETALEQSKERDGKDAMCLFGRPVAWEDFMGMKTVKDRLQRAIDGDGEGQTGLPRSVISQLNMMYQCFAEGRNEQRDVKKRVNRNRYRWLAAYQLRRMARANKRHATLLEEDLLPAITGQRERTVGEARFQEPFINVLPQIVRWTELLTKTKE